MVNHHKTITFISLLFLLGCGNNKMASEQGKIKEAAYFDSLFTMYGNGFTGGDGVYSVELPDGRNVWIIGDTFLGSVTADFKRKKTDPLYIRNSFILQEGDSMTTLHQGEPHEFKSMMIPPEVEEGKMDEHEIWYWPGDAFVKDDTLHVFATKFIQSDTGMWGFEYVETALLSYSLPEIKEVRHQTIQGTKGLDVHFGHAVYQEEDFTYIYGLGRGGPCAARATTSLVTNWEYWNGTKWSENIEDTQPMIKTDGSEQFSIFKHDSRYIYLTQEGGLGDRVYTFVGTSPVGPWSEKKEIYQTPIPFENENLFTYNTLAHPQFSDDSTFLISYNMNSQELSDHFSNAAIYRPRFARIPFSRIFNE